MKNSAESNATRRKNYWKPSAFAIGGILFGYFVIAYLFVPLLWKLYVDRHPLMEDIPNITYAGDGIPGDPLNVALIGTKSELIGIKLAAGWYPADALSLSSSLEIAEATILKRPYEEAPVSNLYLFGRREDLAFEQPVGDNPTQRHHVRYWRTEKQTSDGRPFWVGSATYDRRVGLSHTTGEITHHINADVDAERDHLFDDLQKTGTLGERSQEDNFHKIREGRNGGGDPWRTDGRLFIGNIRPQVAAKQ